MLALEELWIERLRPRPEAGDGHDFLLLGEIDHDRRNAGDIDEIALQNPERNAGSATGVDRIAAGLQYVEPGDGGEIMPRRNGVPGDGDGRPVGCFLGHCALFPRLFILSTVALDPSPLEGRKEKDAL
jgi:hypothetical protein